VVLQNGRRALPAPAIKAPELQQLTGMIGRRGQLARCHAAMAFATGSDDACTTTIPPNRSPIQCVNVYTKIATWETNRALGKHVSLCF